MRRAIGLREGEKIDATALSRAAAVFNTAKKKRKRPSPYPLPSGGG